MSQPNEFLAAMLRRSTRGLAGYAASEFLSATPEANSSWPLTAWQDLLAGRMEELAVAVAVERPAVFAGQVQWARMVHTARGIPIDHLRACLQTLRSVVTEKVPEEYSPIVSAYLDQALAAYDQEPSKIPPLTPFSPHGHLASEYLLVLLEGDRQRASQLILDAAQEGENVPDLYLKVLAPAMVEAGRMWLTDEITVAEEHFITATTKMVVSLLRRYAPPQPCHGKTVIAAAVMGNLHDLGLQMVADFLEMNGWRAIYLGANMPIEDLVQAVNFYKADLLGLSVALTTQLPTLKTTIETVRQSEQGASVKVLVGGAALAGLEDLGRQCGADGYAPDPPGAVALGNRLVGQ